MAYALSINAVPSVQIPGCALDKLDLSSYNKTYSTVKEVPMDRRKVMIDTDCGSDDAMAIAMALRDPAIEVLFLTTCAGNVGMEQATRNTLLTLEQAGSYAPPVYKGCDRPLLQPLSYAYETHGQDGMGDLGLAPQRLTPTPGHGVYQLLSALRSHAPGTLEVVALGPLTNLALAIRLEPETMARVKVIAIMGSAGLGAGNVTPLAEFNIWQDAEAAKVVLESGLPLLLVGWDACLGDAMLSPQDIQRLRDSGPLGRFVIDTNRVLMEMNEERFGQPCLDMADPAAMAAALYPDCRKVCDAYFCEVDVSPGIGYGAVVVDRNHFSGKPANVLLCSQLHADRFKDYLFRTLGA